MHRKLGGFRSLAEVAVVGASLEPGFLHGCYLSAVGWCDWVGVRDVVHCVEPVPALGLHSFQDQWYRRLLHLEDLLVGGVSYCLVCCRHEYCFVSHRSASCWQRWFTGSKIGSVGKVGVDADLSGVFGYNGGTIRCYRGFRRLNLWTDPAATPRCSSSAPSSCGISLTPTTC